VQKYKKNKNTLFFFYIFLTIYIVLNYFFNRAIHAFSYNIDNKCSFYFHNYTFLCNFALNFYLPNTTKQLSL